MDEINIKTLVHFELMRVIVTPNCSSQSRQSVFCSFHERGPTLSRSRHSGDKKITTIHAEATVNLGDGKVN